MNNLVAVAYPNVDTAHKVMDTLGRLQIERSIELEDAVIVTREGDGKVKLHQVRSTTGAGVAGGAMWGGLIGLCSSRGCWGWRSAPRPARSPAR